MAETRHLVLVLGDQLDLDAAAFDGFDPAKDVVWMAEVAEEATHVASSQARTVMFLAAMRHFAQALQALGRPLHHMRLDDPAHARPAVAAALAADPSGFARLEAIVHPLVWQRERQALHDAEMSGAGIVLLDIPLLFENHGEARVDKVVVVSCDPQLQRRRVLERPGMTTDKFEMIAARQMPDAEKRKRADFLIDTGLGLDHARRRVKEILDELRSGSNPVDG